jgi:hypothetical protein
MHARDRPSSELLLHAGNAARLQLGRSRVPCCSLRLLLLEKSTVLLPLIGLTMGLFDARQSFWPLAALYGLSVLQPLGRLAWSCSRRRAFKVAALQLEGALNLAAPRRL